MPCFLHKNKRLLKDIDINLKASIRIALFNELDTCADVRGISTKQFFQGVGLYSRIGTSYNNSSFGYD